MSAELLHDCFHAHRDLAAVAQALARRLVVAAAAESEQLRIAATCVSLASHQAFLARDERTAIDGWTDCERADRQIRRATYHALARGRIGNSEYDRTFETSSFATRMRREELERLRLRLRASALI